MLYIVSLPVGNFKDISERALTTLNEVHLILCEDSRQFEKYKKHYKINQKIISYHDFNEREQTPKIIKLMNEGKKIALVCDSGTPMISDPGYHLLKECYNHKIKATPIPGPSAPIIGVSMCPFNNGEFLFFGFYDSKKHLKLIESSLVDLVFFESPQRIIETLTKLSFLFQENRNIFIAKEMTKEYENFILIKSEEQIKEIIPLGEFVFIIEKKKEEINIIDYHSIYNEFPQFHTKDLAHIISFFKKVKPKEAYENLIRIKTNKGVIK